jgi:hypothetical protein
MEREFFAEHCGIQYLPCSVRKWLWRLLENQWSNAGCRYDLHRFCRRDGTSIVTLRRAVDSGNVESAYSNIVSNVQIPPP